MSTVVFAIPLAAFWVAVADGVPTLDVSQSCRGAASAGFAGQTAAERMQACLASEQRTRELLEKNWATFLAADRTYCANAIKGFAPTYTELATCLETQRDARKIRTTTPDPIKPPTTTPTKIPPR